MAQVLSVLPKSDIPCPVTKLLHYLFLAIPLNSVGESSSDPTASTVFNDEISTNVSQALTEIAAFNDPVIRRATKNLAAQLFNSASGSCTTWSLKSFSTVDLRAIYARKPITGKYLDVLYTLLYLYGDEAIPDHYVSILLPGLSGDIVTPNTPWSVGDTELSIPLLQSRWEEHKLINTPPYWKWVDALAATVRNNDKGDLDLILDLLSPAAYPLIIPTLEGSKTSLAFPNLLNQMLTSQLMGDTTHSRDYVPVSGIAIRNLVTLCRPGLTSPDATRLEVILKNTIDPTTSFTASLLAAIRYAPDAAGGVEPTVARLSFEDAQAENLLDASAATSESADGGDTEDTDATDVDSDIGDDGADTPDTPTPLDPLDGDENSPIKDNNAIGDENSAVEDDELLKYEKETPTRSVTLFRKSVAALNAMLKRNPDIEVPHEARDALDRWCRLSLWFLETDETKKMLVQYKLDKLLKPTG